MSEAHTLDVEHVSFSYPASKQAPGRVVLKDFSVSLQPGRLTVLIGPSGCGKTTLLNLIAGVLTPDGGFIRRPKPPSASRFVAGYVFQSPSLIPWRTIEDNALYGAQISGTLDSQTRERARRLMETYGLSSYSAEYSYSLSGGMQQRLAVVRAIVSGANTLLLDEPFAHSDSAYRQILATDISDAINAQRMIGVLVTHDLEDAIRVADRILVLGGTPMTIKSDTEIPIDRRLRISQPWTVGEKLYEYWAGIREELDA